MSGGSALYTERTDEEAGSTPIFDALLAEQNRDDHWTVAAFPRRFDLVSLILAGVVVLLLVALFHQGRMMSAFDGVATWIGRVWAAAFLLIIAALVFGALWGRWLDWCQHRREVRTARALGRALFGSDEYAVHRRLCSVDAPRPEFLAETRAVVVAAAREHGYVRGAESLPVAEQQR